jgi:hypothetical protein
MAAEETIIPMEAVTTIRTIMEEDDDPKSTAAATTRTAETIDLKAETRTAAAMIPTVAEEADVLKVARLMAMITTHMAVVTVLRAAETRMAAIMTLMAVVEAVILRAVRLMAEVVTTIPTAARVGATTTAITTALSNHTKAVTATAAVTRALADPARLTEVPMTSPELSSRLLNTRATLPTVISSAAYWAC